MTKDPWVTVGIGIEIVALGLGVTGVLTPNEGWLIAGLGFVIMLIPIIRCFFFPGRDLQKPDATKINVYLGNADVFHYRGATASQPSRDIDPLLQIQTNFVPSKTLGFVFGVKNYNASVSLQNVYLHLYLDHADKIVVSNATTIVSNGNAWKCQQPNAHYWFNFSSINPGGGHHPNDILVLMFSRRGLHKIRFEITERQTPNVIIPAEILLH